MFQNMSIKARLWMLSTFQLLMMLLVGGIGTYYSFKVIKNTKQLALVDLPAVKALGLTDMYHDATRGLVFQSLYYSSSDDKSQKDQILNEFKEVRTDFLAQFDKLNSLNIEDEALKSINETKPHVEEYIATAEEIIALANESKFTLAEKKLGALDKIFHILESDFEKLSNLIVENSQVDVTNAISEVNQSNIVILMILLFGFTAGLFTAFYTIQYLSNSLTKTIQLLTQESSSVNQVSMQIHQESQKLSQSTTEQAAAIEETVASSEEMASMLSQTTQQSARSLQISEDGKNESEKGLKVMERLGSAMDDIQHTNEKLESLVRLIEEIKSKTKVINDIVFETRLLSFNASIEAARAGTHGKGFAVVAEEVGKLATMSGKAADEIRTLLESSTSEVSQIVRSTQDKVSIGKNVSVECQSAFQEMGSTLTKINESVTKIASASKEQEIGIKQTNRAMAEMDIVTNNNSQASEKLTSESEKLFMASKSLDATMKGLVSLVFGSNSHTNDLNYNKIVTKNEIENENKNSYTQSQNQKTNSEKKINTESDLKQKNNEDYQIQPQIKEKNTDESVEVSRKGFKWKKSA